MSVDWSKPIQTRDGRKARLLGEIRNQCFVLHARAVCITDAESGNEWVHYVNPDNGSVYNETDDRNWDIINVPEKPPHRCESGYYVCGEASRGRFYVVFKGDRYNSMAALYCPFCGEKAGT